MAPVIPNPRSIRSFRTEAALEAWLAKQHARAPELWLKVHKKGHVARLTKAGRMTPHGQRHVDAAKADGRWDAAYAPMRSATEAVVPDNLRTAVAANARAHRTYRTLSRQNLFLLAFSTNAMRTPAGRARKIMVLARGETVAPQPASRARATRRSDT